MSEQEQTAQQAWHALETFWSPFSFLFGPGATPEQIDVWQEKEGVTLPPDVRAIIGVHDSIGLPALDLIDFSPEVTLSAIGQWLRFDRSILYTEDPDPEFWPDVFKEYSCPSLSIEDYVVIGSAPLGPDYGIYLMLHPESSTVYGIQWNHPSITAFGTMATWLTKNRLGGLKDVAEYPVRFDADVPTGQESGGGASLAEWQRSYLELGYPERLARWDKVEAKFIQTFDALNPG